MAEALEEYRRISYQFDTVCPEAEDIPNPASIRRDISSSLQNDFNETVWEYLSAGYLRRCFDNSSQNNVLLNLNKVKTTTKPPQKNLNLKSAIRKSDVQSKQIKHVRFDVPLSDQENDAEYIVSGTLPSNSISVENVEIEHCESDHSASSLQEDYIDRKDEKQDHVRNLIRKLQKEFEENYKEYERKKLEAQIKEERRQKKRQKESFTRLQKLNEDHLTRKEREELIALRHENENFQEELKRQNLKHFSERRKWKNQMDAAENKIETLRLENFKLEEQLAALKFEKLQEELKQQNLKYSSESRKWKNRIDAAENERDSLRLENIKLKEQCEDLLAALKIETLQEELEQQNLKYSSESCKMKNRIDVSENGLDSLILENIKLDKQCDNLLLALKIEKLQEELKQLNLKYSSKSRKLENGIDVSLNELDNLVLESTKLEEKFDDLYAALKIKKQELLKWKNQIAENERECLRLENIVRRAP